LEKETEKLVTILEKEVSIKKPVVIEENIREANRDFLYYSLKFTCLKRTVDYSWGLLGRQQPPRVVGRD